jgi:uncharacterized membrane protein YraQ (UPF0718 family)
MKNRLYLLFTIIFIVFVGLSYIYEFKAGMQIGRNSYSIGLSFLTILPVFIIISLFKVWVKRETIEKHLGTESGAKGYLLAILLSSSIVGGLVVSLPVAGALYKKGARLSVVLTFIGASCVCRIPLTVFEASFLGLPFTLIRWGLSIPLLILSSYLLTLFKYDDLFKES